MPFLSSRWMLAAGAAVVAGAVLGITGLTPTNVMAGVSHSHWYTHSSSSCTGHKDPINDVFVYNGYSGWVDNHAAHHGSWKYGGGQSQWFKAHNCNKQNRHAASNPSWLPVERYHMRIADGLYGNYSDYDSTWRYWSTADAHHEKWVGCGHAVDNADGFNRGRDNLWYNWTQTGPHVWRDFQKWGNTAKFTQCNGWVAWSDGYVDFIEVRTSS